MVYSKLLEKTTYPKEILSVNSTGFKLFVRPIAVSFEINFGLLQYLFHIQGEKKNNDRGSPILNH